MNHPRTIPARFGSNYLRSFREKKCLMRICLNSLFSIFNKNQWRYTLDKQKPTEYILNRPNYAPTVQIGANSGFKYRCLCPSKNFLFLEMAPILNVREWLLLMPNYQYFSYIIERITSYIWSQILWTGLPFPPSHHPFFQNYEKIVLYHSAISLIIG
jgi:hypothetical protein